MLKQSLQALLFSMLYLSITSAYADFYRYYDAKGRPNVSTSVTPNHIRYGYEVLNNQMFVIRQVPASSHASEKSQMQQAQKLKQQQEELQRLRKAYGSSASAMRKRDEILTKLNHQLAFQNGQYQKLLANNKTLVAQYNNFAQQSKPVPAHLSQQLRDNQHALKNSSITLNNLQQQITQTHKNYNHAIQQLRANGF